MSTYGFTGYVNGSTQVDVRGLSLDEVRELVDCVPCYNGQPLPECLHGNCLSDIFMDTLYTKGEVWITEEYDGYRTTSHGYKEI